MDEGASGPSVRGCDLVRVIARVRPLSEQERQRGDAESVHVRTSEALSVATAGPGGREQERPFAFDACFDAYSSQETFFNNSGVADLLRAAVDGYCATVFAYGQTGSGKTHSMSGPHLEAGFAGGPDDGLIPRSMHYLFSLVAQPPPGVRYTIRSSYCEIYNEQVFDLLNLSTGQLPVRWSDTRSFYVPGLILVECRSQEDMAAVLQEGHRNRRVGSHELNLDSSRSHSLMSVHIESETLDPSDGHAVTRFGKIVFVDLAGSERLKQSKAANMQETGNINRSLFTLGKVISALSSDAERSNDFIPYRDSKLTKLLMDSLGGNSKTLMIACCSPSSSFVEETLSTLNYATRAKSIENKPTLQMDPTERLIENLRSEIQLLRQENAFLRQQLDGRGGPGAATAAIMAASSSSPSPSMASAPPPGLAVGAPPGLAGGPPGLGGAPPRDDDGEWVPQNAVRSMMSAYQGEIDRLRAEHEAARNAEAHAMQSHANIVAENEMLSRKLDHLEQIFVNKNAQQQHEQRHQHQHQQWRSPSIADDEPDNRQLESKIERLRTASVEPSPASGSGASGGPPGL